MGASTAVLCFGPCRPIWTAWPCARPWTRRRTWTPSLWALWAGCWPDWRWAIPPCTPTACLELLRFYHIPMEGQKVAVVGKSMTVGLPTALLMMNEEATVSVCHILSQPEDTRKLCQQADIVISAAGCAGLIKADYVRPGQVVVDVGVNVGKDGVMRGDAAFEEVEPIVKAITPVPGGVGAITSTVLMAHVVEAAMRQNGLKEQ